MMTKHSTLPTLFYKINRSQSHSDINTLWANNNRRLTINTSTKTKIQVEISLERLSGTHNTLVVEIGIIFAKLKFLIKEILKKL